MTGRSTKEQRIAVLSPTGRDAELTCKALTEAGIDCAIATDVHALCAIVRDGVGAILIAEEAIFSDEAFGALERTLAQQPQWSDLPVLVLTGRGADSPTAARALEKMGNVTLLERPLRVGSLVSNARAALARAPSPIPDPRAHCRTREIGGGLARGRPPQRTSSWRRSRTNCAIRSRRSAMRRTYCT